MMQDDFLFEMLTAELPAKLILNLAQQLVAQFKLRLTKARLEFAEIEYFATPRRLAIYVKKLTATQPDQVVEKRGPARNKAYTETGEPTKATLGFAKSCGVNPQDLTLLQTPEGEWLAFSKKEAGKKVETLLPELVNDVLATLILPKRMRWGAGEQTFIRPVMAMIMLYGHTIIKANIMGCDSQNQTCGHRFMAPEWVTIPHPSQYKKLLSEHKVIASFEERRALIDKAIHVHAGERQIFLSYDDYVALLDEVTGLVEWPVVLSAHFDNEFLALPAEVLVAAMKDHQRYFPLCQIDKQACDAEFLFVANIDSSNPSSIITGNERVLRARLADAAFFYAEDKRINLAARLPRLAQMVYQAKLGTLRDKAERLKTISVYLAEQFKINPQYAERAALLCKADLVTHMVGEFPELQGVMGGYYAIHDQEPTAIAEAIKEHYFPRFSKDKIPTTLLGKIVALADRIDLLVGSFGIGQVPTGDKDPYGLRRAALGIVRILIEGELDLDLKNIIGMALNTFDHHLNVDTTHLVLPFILDRMRAAYLEKGIAADVFAAVAALEPSNLLDMHKRIDALNTFKSLPEVQALSSANKRVSNILMKYDERLLHDEIDPALFEHDAEIILAKQVMLRTERIRHAQQQSEYHIVLQELQKLREPLDAFFEHVMVMSPDKSRRDNRILLLKQLRHLFLQVADIALLQAS